MTPEEFNRITKQCQPHKVFKLDWKTYYSEDFGNTFLPDIEPIGGKAFLMYDGADFFRNLIPTERKLLKLTRGTELISLTFYTYPKGVLAQKRKDRVSVEDFEICAFIEVDENDKLEIFFKFGRNFKDFLYKYFTENKINKNPEAVEKTIYKSNTKELMGYFNNSIVHYSLMAYVGKTIGVDLVAVNKKVAYELKINKISISSSTLSGNLNKHIKSDKEEYINIDFTIYNYPSTEYRIIIYKNNEKIDELVFLPEIVIIPNKEKIDTQTENTLYKAGKHRIVYECSNTDILIGKNENDKITLRIQATNENKEIAYDQKELLLKIAMQKAATNNYILLVDPNKKEGEKDCYIKIYANEILKKQKIIKNKIPKAEYNKLSVEEKLIIDLPIILVKLDWLYSAYCQLYWLEGSGEDIYLPISFVESYARVQDALKQMKNDFSEIEYASYMDETNYNPNLSIDDSSNRFLYNISLNQVKLSYNKATAILNKITDFGEYDFGNFDMKEANPKLNFVRSYTIGSHIGKVATGDKDDLGGALGLFALRIYIKGKVTKQEFNSNQVRLFYLNISNVGYRYFDDFSFD